MISKTTTIDQLNCPKPLQSTSLIFRNTIRKMVRKRRFSKGKQRIEIKKKIEFEEARQDCFSRHKAGIFSKANEIATLCGAKVDVLIQSPTGCPFTFGSPSVNHVIRRFLNGGVGVNETEEYEAQRLLKIQELNSKVMEASSKFEEALKRKQMLIRRITELCEANEDVWRVENVEDLNLDELRKMVESLDKFKKTIRAKLLNDMAAKSGHPILAILNFSGNGTGQRNVSGHGLVELDLLGGFENFAAEKKPK